MGGSEEVDVVVVGSGAAGMAAALAAALRGSSVMLIEAAACYGGTTAYSGGAIWIPCNPLMHQAGLADNIEDARRYMAALAGDSVSEVVREAYLREGPEMVREFNERTRWVRWRLLDYPDYRCPTPGSLPGGRSLEPEILDGRLLGPDLAQLRPISAAMDTGRATITSLDFAALNMVARTWRGKKAAARVAGRTIASILRGQLLLGLGRALVGRLLLALRDLDVRVMLETPLTGLLLEEGRVAGVKVGGPAGIRQIRARGGVVLAAGGFSRNDALRAAHLPQPSDQAWALCTADNQQGDGIVTGTSLGAHTALMHRTWGMPTFIVELNGEPAALLSHVDRSLPGTLVVNDEGCRYADETLSYEDFWKRMYETGAGSSWFLFDQRVKDRYIVLRTPPRIPFPKAWFSKEYVFCEADLNSLARRMSVPAASLATTVSRFNDLARAGKDADFGRGETALAHFFGDSTLQSPNLAPLDHPPFYAIRMHPGELSTKGGLVVDEYARVLGDDGIIPHLYAAGNNAAAPGVGDSYPGAGGTLGPAMVFGYIAGKHAAGLARRPQAISTP